LRKCPRCGRNIEDKEKYCPYCGLDLQRKHGLFTPRKKSVSLLLSILIFFSFFAIPFLYVHFLDQIGEHMVEQTLEEVKELPDINDDIPMRFIASYETLADFKNQFTNVDDIVDSIHEYEVEMTQNNTYTFDKKYLIQILNNYNIYYQLQYHAKISDRLSVTIQREYDRMHRYNRETIIFEKDGAKVFNDLLLSEEEMKIVSHFTGEQEVTQKLITDFSKREAEFNAKKKNIGHYGIGNYDGRSSFVVYRKDEQYISKLTYYNEPKDFIC